MTIARSTRIQAYQMHKSGTYGRMAILRMIAADSANNRNEATRLQPGDWRGARSWKMNTYESAFCWGLHQGNDSNHPVWYTHGGEYFRNERDAHEILRSRHHGWYTDTDGDETAIGIVAMLPHGRFITGFRWTANDERVYFPEVFTDEDDAARMADEHARVFAESAREDDERFNAMIRAEDKVNDKIVELQESIALRHKPRFGGKDRVRDAIEELRNAREELKTATADYERG